MEYLVYLDKASTETVSIKEIAHDEGRRYIAVSHEGQRYQLDSALKDLKIKLDAGEDT